LLPLADVAPDRRQVLAFRGGNVSIPGQPSTTAH